MCMSSCIPNVTQNLVLDGFKASGFDDRKRGSIINTTRVCDRQTARAFNPVQNQILSHVRYMRIFFLFCAIALCQLKANPSSEEIKMHSLFLMQQNDLEGAFDRY